MPSKLGIYLGRCSLADVGPQKNVKMLKAIIKPEYIEKLKNDDDFILAIQLSRIVNSLSSNFRSYINVSNDNHLINVKDRIDLLLIHGAMLYEAIKVFTAHGKRLKEFKIWDQISSEFKVFTQENGNKNSFKNTVLSKIRNKIFFHFDHDIISETLKKVDFPDGITFITAKSTKQKDIIYSLVDDLILSYLVQLEDSKEKSSEKYEKVEKTIIDLSDRLCKLIDVTIKELLPGEMEFIEEDE
jgi:hypothetical protein